MDGEQITLNADSNLKEAHDGVLHVTSKPSYFKLPCGGDKCNAKCSFCPMHEQKISNTDMKIVFSIYDKLKPLFASAAGCCIVDWCEPMLSPIIEDLYFQLDSECSDSAIFSVVTNGIFINPDVVRILSKREHSIIAVSLNAANETTYKRLMGVDSFTDVCSNIKMLSENNNIDITINIVLNLENYRDFPDLVALSSELGANAIYLQDMFLWTNEGHTLSCLNSPDLVKTEVSKGYKIARALGISILHHIPSSYTNISQDWFSCCEPWRQFNVANDGEVRLCCFAPVSLGNILHDDYDSIWNSEKMKEIRRGLFSGDLSSECSNCYQRWLDADFNSLHTIT